MRRAVALGALGASLFGTAAAAGAGPSVGPVETGPLVKIRMIRYRAHDGIARRAYVLLPGWYGRGDDPPIPLVISPHGRGIGALDDAQSWGDLPDLGRFAVVCPDGQGRRLEYYSWGDPGQISDLARMPSIVRHATPWLRIARGHVFAFGGSMGGQEVLLL